eukprot:Nitzschia sp. Nitz4//scaffold27_size158506//53309//53842//NITZ4_002595-RA/size158506-processed-gene-0.72-mRNA-1//-1//CDS//3329545473//7269//frame0
MVLGNALCALNLASTVMANGVCCFYEMQREEERMREQQQSIRQAVHSEWERQRFLEMMERQREKELEAKVLQSQRRRNVMQSKHESDRSSSRDKGSMSPRSSPPRSPVDSISSGFSHSTQRRQPRERTMSSESVISGKSHSRFVINTSAGSNQHLPERQLSSLMDDLDDEMEDIVIE